VIKDKIIFDLSGKNGIMKGDANILKMVREKFSVPNPSFVGRKFHPRKYIITPSSVFEIGLLNDIVSYIDSLDIPIDTEITPQLQKVFTPSYPNYEIQNIDGFTYYDHQLNTLKEFIDNGRGIGLLATSAGKSLILAGLAKTLTHYKPNTKILVIVPNTGLLNQIYYSFLEEFNLPIITRWGDGNIPDMSKNVVVANSQILVSDVIESVKMFQDFDCVIVDEVHRLGEKTNQINKVVHNIKTPHKFGLTGTLPDNYLAAWNVVGKIGPILYEESSYSIRLKGVASKVKIKIIICEHDGKPEKPIQIGKQPLLPTAFYEKEKEFVYSSPMRNKIISKLCSKLNGNTLILVDTLDYGEHLLNILQSVEGKIVYFIQGSMSTDERQRIIKQVEENDNIVVVAMSQIFSTGISVRNLKYLFFTMIGKSTVKISQSIGRIMRLHENKDEAIIFDIADNTSYSQSHLKQRIALYKKDTIPFEIKKLKL
jgi:superfamily II DNA or RNA helicase